MPGSSRPSGLAQPLADPAQHLRARGPSAGAPLHDGHAAPSDLAALIAESYPAIRRMAAARARGGPIQATSLANEAVCRLLKSARPPKNAEHLKAIAAQLLGWLITDRQRAAGASRRREKGNEDLRNGSASPEGLSTSATSTVDARDALARVFGELADQHPRQADVFVLSTLAGVTQKQIAEQLGIDDRTVRRDYEFARAFLDAKLRPGSDHTSPDRAGSDRAGSRSAEGPP